MLVPEPGEEQMMEALRRWKDDRQVAATILQAVELLDIVRGFRGFRVARRHAQSRSSCCAK